jgi:hypothetical protein
LVAQGTREIEILNQIAPRKKGFETSNQGATIKGLNFRCIKETWFFPWGQGVGMPWGDLVGTEKGIK